MRHSFSILTTISVFVLTSTTSYAATRHCTATVKANVYSGNTQTSLNAPPIKKLDVFSFKAGGVATLPNKARNRAKKNAYQCITQHFFTYYLASENGGITGMPRDCTTANRIPEYDMTKSLYKKIKSTVCGALPQKKYFVQTWVYVSGKKGCKGSMQLYHNDNPYTAWREITCN